MIKTIITIIKFVIIGAVGLFAINGVLWLVGILDWSLFSWVGDEYQGFELDFMRLLDYPNTWILISYMIGRSLLFVGLDLIVGKVRERSA